MTRTRAAATPADPVAAAEQDAREADELVAALEERVRSGDAAVSPEQLAAQEAVAKFARLRAEAARRTAEQERKDAHDKACNALRQEIESAALSDDKQLAADLHAFEDSALRFITAINSRNDQVREWRHRMQTLGVPAGLSALDEYGGLGLTDHDSTLIAGAARVDLIKPEQHLGRILARLQDASRLSLEPFRNAAHQRAYEILANELGAA